MALLSFMQMHVACSERRVRHWRGFGGEREKEERLRNGVEERRLRYVRTQIGGVAYRLRVAVVLRREVKEKAVGGMAMGNRIWQ